jgi:N-acetylglutamate synthase-like GNAT family acetyltransferase
MMNIRPLTLADKDAAIAFARKHWSHPLDLDADLRESMIQVAINRQEGYLFVAESEGGFQAIVRCIRKAEEPPFADQYYFDVIIADRERQGKQALDAVLPFVMNKVAAEAGAPTVAFCVLSDEGDTLVGSVLQNAGFGRPWVTEMGRARTEKARELPVPEGITVRLATLEDAARLSEMTIALTHPIQGTPTSWIETMILSDSKFYLAESEGRIVGVAGGRMVGEGKAIGFLFMVEEEYQGKGLGKFLYNKFCLEFRAMGVKTLPGIMQSERHRRFYEQFGFERVKGILIWDTTVKAV